MKLIRQFIDGMTVPMTSAVRDIHDKSQCDTCREFVTYDAPDHYVLDDWYILRSNIGLTFVNGVTDGLDASLVPQSCRAPNHVLFPPFESGPRSSAGGGVGKICGWTLCHACVDLIEDAIALEDQYRIGTTAARHKTYLMCCLHILPRELGLLIVSYLAYPSAHIFPSAAIIDLQDY
jgi:hypothetical protein